MHQSLQRIFLKFDESAKSHKSKYRCIPGEIPFNNDIYIDKPGFNAKIDQIKCTLDI